MYIRPNFYHMLETLFIRSFVFNSYFLQKFGGSISISLNCVPFVPTCLTGLRALGDYAPYVPSCLKLLRAYVLTCLSYLIALRAYMPTCFACLRTSKLYVTSSLNTLIYVPTCPLLLRGYVP